MNLKPNQRLPLLTQHINSERCLCLQGYALGNQYVVRELIMAMPEENAEEGSKFRLKKLDIALSESFVNQIIASGLDAEQDKQTLSHLRFCFLDDTRILSRLLINDDKTILALSWKTHIIGSKQIEFQLDSVMPLGSKQSSSLDSCYDAIGVALGCLDKLGMRHFYRYIKNTIRIDIVESICHTIFHESPEYEISIEGGGLHLSKDGSDIHLVYDERFASNTSQIEKPNHELVEIYDWPDDKDEAASKEAAEAYTKASKLTAISKLQQIIYANKPLTLPIAVAALEEAKTELHPALTPALLYIIHKYEPGHDDALKLQTLSANAASQNDFLIYKILESVYKKQKNYTLLLELKQRVLKRSEHTPRRAIDTGIEVADILAQNMGHYTQAIKRLDDMKLRVSMHGTNSQKLAFAEAYHRSQGTSMAIHLLRQYMNQSTKAEEIAEFGYAVAKMMVEHNEPPQSIINACASVLEQVPDHLGTQKIFANCLKSCGRLEDAAFAYELILDHLSLDYESEVAREKLAYLPKSEKSAKVILKEAVEIAETLENLYGLLEREPQKCIVLKQHLRLKPDDITVLSKLLKHFESIFYYDEMVQVCYDFLEKNQGNLNPDHEISIRLTLHNIFDQKILKPEEALFHLSKARELAALDPRVLMTEIERYKRRGLKQEQIGLRQALIDVLPADEAVEQALELVRLYEELGPNIAEISTVLRKAQSLNPQHRDVLLELRHYLRKSGQFFELASVLEKLARVTNDNQSRKSILLEASETHRKLENHTLAQKLYNEAQLCGPINPNLKADYLPGFLGNGRNANHNDEMWQTLFLADSQADANLSFGTSDAGIDDKYHHTLTSRSLSLVAETTGSTDEHKVSDLQKNISRLTASEAPPLARFYSARRKTTHPQVETTLALDNTEIDESAPLEQQIAQARLKGNTKALLERLIKSVEDVEAKEQQPRILLEIGCLYLYDLNNYETAKVYLERAASLSTSVAEGEQTLNALEMIYKTLEQYKELGQIYEKKRDISTIPLEKKRYEILAAQLYYMHLGDTQKAIDTLERTLEEAPNNESALQLLAQIYVDTQDYDKAIEYLNKISKLLKQGSKVHAQHLLKLVALYTRANRIEEAKVCLRQLLRDNNHVDKLAVIEQFKRICRLNDQWEELLEILNDELCYYLHLPRETFSLDLFTEDEHPEIPFGYAAHTIREYADVLYYKLENVTSSVKLYRTLAILHPEDNYSSEMLRDIVESHPQSSEAVEALMAACHPDFLREKSLESPLTTLPVSHSELSIIDSNDSFEQLGEAYKCYKKGEISKAKELLSRLENSLLGQKKTRQISLLIEVVKNHWTALEDKPKQDTDHDHESESKESNDLTEKPLLK